MVIQTAMGVDEKCITLLNEGAVYGLIEALNINPFNKLAFHAIDKRLTKKFV